MGYGIGEKCLENLNSTHYKLLHVSGKAAITMHQKQLAKDESNKIEN